MSYEPKGLKNCPACNGSGIETSEPLGKGPYIPKKMSKCKNCGGSGLISRK